MNGARRPPDGPTSEGGGPADRLARARATWFSLDLDAVRAVDDARRVLAAAEARGEPLTAAHARCTIGWYIGSEGGDLSEALEHLAEIGAVVERTGDEQLRVRWHCAAACVWGAIGDRSVRFEQLELMRVASVAIGDVWHELVALHDMAVMYDRDDLLEMALERAEAVAHTLAEPPSMLVSLLVRTAERLSDAGRPDRAEQRARQAVSVAVSAGLPVWRALALAALARVVATAGRADEAHAALADMDALARLAESQRLLAHARVHRALGARDHAIATYERLLALPEVPRGPRDVLAAARELAPLQAAAGSWQRAYEVQVRYEELRSAVHQDDDTRRLRGLEVHQRVTMARQQVEQEQARNRDLARHVAQLERTNREVNELASRDPLTGLFNRRHADAELVRLLAAAAFARTPASVALVDADHFKSVNDRFGHPVGDRVLHELAGLIGRELRATDLAARFGGEEFLVLLPATGLDEARQACERIRVEVAGHDWTAFAPDLTMTVSIGVVQADPGSSPAEVVAAADARLYEAKRAGRDVVRG